MLKRLQRSSLYLNCHHKLQPHEHDVLTLCRSTLLSRWCGVRGESRARSVEIRVLSTSNRSHVVIFQFFLEKVEVDSTDSSNNGRFTFSFFPWGLQHRPAIPRTPPVHDEELINPAAGGPRWMRWCSCRAGAADGAACRSQSLVWATGGKLCRKAQEKGELLQVRRSAQD